ncbi:hypothetical protein C8R46DRAFT_1027834 [Mycena filopes]|nr:hypothetical protein C8R46DRAFT_1027834 [Mycena filopes]
MPSYIAEVSTEVWSICRQFCALSDFSQLSLTSRHFRRICQPLLFRHQQFRCRDPAGGSAGLGTRQTGLDTEQTINRLNALAESPHALSVRRWDWVVSCSDYEYFAESHPDVVQLTVPPERWSRLVSTFTSRLGAYRRITTLELFDLNIDVAFRITLASLRLLDDLTLTMCLIASTGPLLSLHRLSITGEPERQEPDGVDGWYREVPLPLAVPDRLERLFLGSAWEVSNVMIHLTKHGLPNLVTLSIETDPYLEKQLLALLGCCPRLETLEIRNETTNDSALACGPGDWLTSFPPLAPSTSPASSLRSYRGNPEVAAYFIRDCPVVDVSLTSHILTEEIIPIIRKLTPCVPLQKLSIATSICPSLLPDILDAINSQFPQLRTLLLHVREPLPSCEERSDPHNCYVGEDPDDYTSDGEEPNERMMVEGMEAIVLSNGGEMEVSGYMDLEPQQDPPSRLGASGSALRLALELIYSGEIILPQFLEVLHLPSGGGHKPFIILDAGEQHGAVSALEGLLPTLREIGLGDGAAWIRIRGAWRSVDDTAR